MVGEQSCPQNTNILEIYVFDNALSELLKSMFLSVQSVC